MTLLGIPKVLVDRDHRPVIRFSGPDPYKPLCDRAISQEIQDARGCMPIRARRRELLQSRGSLNARETDSGDYQDGKAYQRPRRIRQVTSKRGFGGSSRSRYAKG